MLLALKNERAVPFQAHVICMRGNGLKVLRLGIYTPKLAGPLAPPFPTPCQDSAVDIPTLKLFSPLCGCFGSSTGCMHVTVILRYSLNLHAFAPVLRQQLRGVLNCNG